MIGALRRCATALALGALATACSSSADAPCGRSALVDGAAGYPWAYGAVAGGVVWFDPGDGWTADDGSGTSDGTGSDGSSGDDGSGDPSAGDPSAGDTGGDTGGDGSDAMRLRLSTVGSASPPLASGCYGCTIVCGVDATPGNAAATHAARGVSDASVDGACTAAVQELETWAHGTEHRRIGRCAQVDDAPPPPARQPAAPTVALTR